MKGRATVLAIAVAACVLAFFVLRKSDEDRIRAQLTRLVAAVHLTKSDTSLLARGARMRDELGAVLDGDVRVRAPEIASPMPTSPLALADATTEWTLLYASLDVDLADVRIKLDDAKETADVEATAKLAGIETDGQRIEDTRPTSLHLRKRDGTWRVTSVTVWANEPR